jgi:PIN domain nuclease of toxin-antitoxin system
MSLVNYAEVRQRFWRDNINPAPYFEIFEATPVQLLSPDRDQARDAGDLERLTKPIGASLADRFCLGLALSRNLPVVTTDKPWDRLGLPLDIRQLR